MTISGIPSLATIRERAVEEHKANFEEFVKSVVKNEIIAVNHGNIICCNNNNSNALDNNSSNFRREHRSIFVFHRR